MSLIRLSSASPLVRIVSAYSFCSVSKSVSNSSAAIPMTPFMGVRISWLMFAKNADFARVAASASLRA